MSHASILRHAVRTGALAFVLAAGLSGGGSARAGDDEHHACKPDVEKFCKDTPHERGQIVHCLLSHEKELAPACQQHIAEKREKFKEAREACRPDAEKLCANVKPGGGAIIRCLKEHESELSDACKKVMTEHHEHHKQATP